MSKETLEPRTARERALCRMAIRTLWDVNRTRAITDMFVIGAPSPTPEEIANKLFPEPAPRLREVTWTAPLGEQASATFVDGKYRVRLGRSLEQWHTSAVDVLRLVCGVPYDATLRALLDLPNNPTLPPEPEPTCACEHEVIGYEVRGHSGFVKDRFLTPIFALSDAKRHAINSAKNWTGATVHVVLKGPEVPAHE